MIFNSMALSWRLCSKNYSILCYRSNGKLEGKSFKSANSKTHYRENNNIKLNIWKSLRWQTPKQSMWKNNLNCKVIPLFARTFNLFVGKGRSYFEFVASFCRWQLTDVCVRLAGLERTWTISRNRMYFFLNRWKYILD